MLLAHISDVHLSPVAGFTPAHWNLKRGLGYLNWTRRRRHVHRRETADALIADMQRHEPDHIAVTGDLVNIGLPREYETAHAWLHTVGPPDRVSVVPGNHDIYTRLHRDPGVERWRDYMTSDAAGRALWAGVRDKHSAASFPFVRRIGPLALIGVCSAVPTPPFVASGEVGAAQLARLGAILDAARTAGLIRVVLIHHPPLPGQAPPRRALRDAAAMADVLARHGADMVLHGHNHLAMSALHPGRHGLIPVVGIPSGSAAVRHKREPLARYNLLRFEHRDGRLAITLTARGLHEEGGAVVEIAREVLHSGT